MNHSQQTASHSTLYALALDVSADLDLAMGAAEETLAALVALARPWDVAGLPLETAGELVACLADGWVTEEQAQAWTLAEADRLADVRAALAE